jgi:Rod binding domain-containing protein
VIGPGSLPPIDEASLPPEIRKGSKQDRQDYQAALGFERMLIGELTKAMADTAKPDDSAGKGQDAASSMYMQMLPDQLADGIVAGGGLGLAQSFYDSVKENS